MMEVTTATATIPYIPSTTVINLPITVVAAKSPKPIVVTTAKQYHKASPKLVMVSSTVISTKAEATIVAIKPNKTSRAKVLTIILNKTLNFSSPKAMPATSAKAVMVINKHSIKTTLARSSTSTGMNKPTPNSMAIKITIALKTIALMDFFSMILKIRETMTTKQYNPAVKEKRYVSFFA